jgi:pimeloyl-ACP methyl ester carboxylesterase
MRPTRLLAALPAAVALALGPAAAAQAIDWTPCSSLGGFQCGALAVPLDHSHTVDGTVTLSVERVAAAQNPSRTAVVGLAGGPGQAVLPIATGFADLLGPGLGDKDLLLFDQRGTGRSGPLDCPAAHTQATVQEVSRACALQLGRARGFYRTIDSAEDLEDLRAAGGYEKLVIYGVSYGTKVALTYATQHPDRVAGLVLDSVVPLDGPDPLRRSMLRAVPRVLRSLCAKGACARATSSPTADLKTLARRLRAKRISGRVVDARGRKATGTLTENGLARILLAGDLNPALRADLPGAVRAALRGDRTPLLRLSGRSAGLSNRAQSQAESDNNVLFLTTTCEETRFPWARDASAGTRAEQAVSAARGLPSGATGFFSSNVPLALGPFSLCLSWPVASPAPPDPGPLPDVPVLVVEGSGDLRTPLEDGRAVAAAFPRGQVLEVPFAGHSAGTSDFTGCVKTALGQFFSGATVAPCGASKPTFRPTPRPPRSLSALKPEKGTRGRAGRTVAAVRATVGDAASGARGGAIALNRIDVRVGGLRGGYARVTQSGTLSLVGYVYVPGVTVSGFVPSEGIAKLRVRGSAAAHGSLQFTATGRASGRLGGSRIKNAVPATAAAFTAGGLPSYDRIRALPGFGRG